MKLDEIAKLCEAATPGPWERAGGQHIRDAFGDNVVLIFAGRPTELIEANARFIASSRTFLPKLLRVAEAAKNYTATFAGTMTNEAPTVTDLESLRITMRSLVAALADMEATE